MEEGPRQLLAVAGGAQVGPQIAQQPVDLLGFLSGGARESAGSERTARRDQHRQQQRLVAAEGLAVGEAAPEGEPKEIREARRQLSEVVHPQRT